MRARSLLMAATLLGGFWSASAVFAADKTFKVDPSKTEIVWHGKKVLVDAPHHGSIQLKEGTITCNDKGEPLKGSFVIDMQTIKNKDMDVKGKEEYKTKLETHLNSADFFDTANHKTAKLTVTKVEKLANKKYKMSGDLEIKGKANPVSFDADVDVNGDNLKAAGELTFDRTLYDVRFGSGKFFQNLGDKVIDDKIKLEIKDLVAKRS